MRSDTRAVELVDTVQMDRKLQCLTNSPFNIKTPFELEKSLAPTAQISRLESAYVSIFVGRRNLTIRDDGTTTERPWSHRPVGQRIRRASMPGITFSQVHAELPLHSVLKRSGAERLQRNLPPA